MALLGKAALAMWWEIDAAAMGEFAHWHAHEHFPERLGIRMGHTPDGSGPCEEPRLAGYSTLIWVFGFQTARMQTPQPVLDISPRDSRRDIQYCGVHSEFPREAYATRQFRSLPARVAIGQGGGAEQASRTLDPLGEGSP